MTYRTLAELVEAYKRGDLDREECPIVLDNDSTAVHVPGAEPYTWNKVFQGGMPEDLLREALDLLGVPWRNA